MENTGLTRPLNPGDAVILSTGATATVRGSYGKGYDGDVAILLDGAEETERVSGLTLPEERPAESGPPSGDSIAAEEVSGENRAPSRRMED